jgi:tetratricopeptide (TPR) repeat protein
MRRRTLEVLPNLKTSRSASPEKGVASRKSKKSYLPVLLAFVLTVCATGQARADRLADCVSAATGQRIAPCSLVIDDPTTTARNLERALVIRSIDFAIVKRFADAKQDLDRALQLNPQSAIALNGRAWTVYRWKNTADGMDDVNASLRLDGTYAAAWDTRAHLYQVLGQFDKAFNEYEAAVGFGGEAFIRTYQCGLKERGLYNGPADGIYTAAVRAALRKCAYSASCDPLPENEFQQECESVSS